MDSEDGAAVARGALTARRRLLLIIAIVAALAVVVAGGVWALTSRSAPAPLPTHSVSPTSSPTPTVTETPLPATTAASDLFDGWGVMDGGGSTRFLATDPGRGGGEALLVMRPDGDVTNGVPAVAQNVEVAQDSRIVVSFWAASSGSATEGAVQVVVGAAAQSVVRLPAGQYDWTRFSVAWVVPPKVTTATITVAATAATAGTRIDDFAVQGQGSRGVEVRNGGFDDSSAAVAIEGGSLVLQRTDALELTSRLAPAGGFGWSLREYTGGAAIAGRGRFEDGRASIPLADVPTGYYSLTLRVSIRSGTVQRTTDLVVTTPMPEGASSPMLAVGVHFGGESDQQLAQKIADLAALGIRSARTDADWATIEKTAGLYDFAALDRVVGALRQVGIRPLLIPDYRNPLYDGGRTPSTPAGIAAYARFAAVVGVRYPDADIEVYNEFDFRFNNGTCGPTPQCYLQLLGPTAAAVRGTGTRGTVVGPGIAGIGVQQDWLQGFINGGGLGSVGALTFHPYVQPERPDVLDGQLTTLRASMTAAGAGTLPIWFTEYGDATVPGWVSERQQAEDLARVLGVAAGHGVSRIYWYDAIDDGPDRKDNEDNFGLFRAPTSLAPGVLVPKPAAGVAAVAIRAMAGADPAAVAVDRPGGAGRVARFGTDRALAWSVTSDEVDVKVPKGLKASTMTGRRIAAPRSLGPGPVWLSGNGVASVG